MNSKNLQIMKENFEGKVCSIFTGPLNRNFNDRQWREHFAVRVLEINSECLWAKHPYINTISCIFLEDIKVIQEEIELDPNNPQHAAMIKEYEEQIQKTVVSDVSPHLAPNSKNLPILTQAPQAQPKIEEPVLEGQNGVLIDIDELNALTKYTKQKEEFN